MARYELIEKLTDSPLAKRKTMLIAIAVVALLFLIAWVASYFVSPKTSYKGDVPKKIACKLDWNIPGANLSQSKVKDDLMLIITLDSIPSVSLRTFLMAFYNWTFQLQFPICNHTANFDGHQFMCGLQIMEQFPNENGYVIIGTDAMIKIWNFQTMRRDRFWISTQAINNFIDVEKTNQTEFMGWKINKTNTIELVSKLTEADRGNLTKNTNQNQFTFVGSDAAVYYVPQIFRTDMIRLGKLFSDYSIPQQIAIPTIMTILSDPRNFEFMTECIWEGSPMDQYYCSYPNFHYVIPCLFQDPECRHWAAEQFTEHYKADFTCLL